MTNMINKERMIFQKNRNKINNFNIKVKLMLWRKKLNCMKIELLLFFIKYRLMSQMMKKLNLKKKELNAKMILKIKN